MSSSDERVVTLVWLFRQTARLMVDQLVRRMAELGYPEVTPSWHSVFENLDRGGTGLSVLARRAGMTHQAMGELVRAIETHRYLERVPDPHRSPGQSGPLYAGGPTAGSHGAARDATHR